MSSYLTLPIFPNDLTSRLSFREGLSIQSEPSIEKFHAPVSLTLSQDREIGRYLVICITSGHPVVERELGGGTHIGIERIVEATAHAAPSRAYNEQQSQPKHLACKSVYQINVRATGVRPVRQHLLQSTKLNPS